MIVFYHDNMTISLLAKRHRSLSIYLSAEMTALMTNELSFVSHVDSQRSLSHTASPRNKRQVLVCHLCIHYILFKYLIILSTTGSLVGYSIKGDNKYSAQTRILFVTYGILLKRMTADPLLEAVDYLVLDEVHGMQYTSIVVGLTLPHLFPIIYRAWNRLGFLTLSNLASDAPATKVEVDLNGE